MKLNLETINELLADEQYRGLSVTRVLQPLDGTGSAVAPPSYAGPQGAPKGPRYVDSERRLEDGTVVKTCLLDSPQSQANRVEETLLRLVRAGDLELPLHELVVLGLGVLTDLDLPHRVFDAAIGSAKLDDGKTWSRSPIARRL